MKYNKRKKLSESHKNKIRKSLRGRIPWNKGLTKDIDKRVKEKADRAKENKKVLRASRLNFKKASESNIGRRHSIEWRKKQSDGLKRYKRTKKHQRKITEARRGLGLSDKTKEKMSIARRGNKNPNFNNWSSREPYDKKWTKELKEKVKRRDGYICQFPSCKKTEEEERKVDGLKRGLIVHHIDYNKKNCKMDNLITICRVHNSIVNYNRKYWTEFFRKKIKDR